MIEPLSLMSKWPKQGYHLHCKVVRLRESASGAKHQNKGMTRTIRMYKGTIAKLVKVGDDFEVTKEEFSTIANNKGEAIKKVTKANPDYIIAELKAYEFKTMMKDEDWVKYSTVVESKEIDE